MKRTYKCSACGAVYEKDDGMAEGSVTYRDCRALVMDPCIACNKQGTVASRPSPSIAKLKMYGRLDAPTLMKRVQEAMEALFVRDDATLDQKVIATLWQHFLESGATL